MSGFYLMHRGWQDHPVFNNEPYSERTAWVWLIETAAWKPLRKRVGGTIVALDRGQLVGSVRILAERWRWSKSRVDRFLKRLAAESMIGTATDAGVNVITICNYDKYQAERDGAETESGTAAGHERDSSGTTKKEVKEGNNSSVAKATGADAPEDLRTMVFGSVLRWWMKATGDDEKPARAFLAKQCKDFNNGAVVLAVAALQSRPPPIYEPKSALIDELKRISSNAPSSRPLKETADERAQRRRAGLAAAVMAGDMGSSGAGAGFGGLDLAGDGGGGTVIDAGEPEVRRGDAGPDPRATRAA